MEALIHRANNYPDILSEMPRYCCLIKFLFWFFSFIEIGLKFRTTCEDHQVGESAVKCLSQGHSRMAQVGFKQKKDTPK